MFLCFPRAWLEAIEEPLLGYDLIPRLWPPHIPLLILLPPSSCHVAPEQASYPLETYKSYSTRLEYVMNLHILLTLGFLDWVFSSVFFLYLPFPQMHPRLCFVFLFVIKKKSSNISLVSPLWFFPLHSTALIQWTWQGS